MSKSILLSIKPKYVADILNGKKTIEIRKTLPKCDLPITVYIYCSQGGMLWKEDNWFACDIKNYKPSYNQSGKVVAKFTVRKVEEIAYECGNNGISKDGYKWFYTDSKENPADLENASCLDEHDLFAYLQPKEAGGSICGYAYHIEDLVIFDKPKELSEFKRKHYPQYAGMSKNTIHYELVPIIKAPQSFIYINIE